METKAVEPEVDENLSVMETEDGKVTFSLDYEVGNLVALLVDEAKNYTFVKMDRSQDRSTGSYYELLRKWVDSRVEEPHALLDAGELMLDDSDPFTHYLYLDDNLVAVVTTYPIPGPATCTALYRIRQPDHLYYMHIAHQLIVPGTEYTSEFAGRLAVAYFTERNRTARV